MKQQQKIGDFDYPVGHVILVAVSGGPDSMALLSMLNAKNVELHAVYINHKQRPGESIIEQEGIRIFCQERGITFHLEYISHKADHWSNKQAFFRNERYRILKNIARQEKITYIATGHHFDDQVETIFMRMIKGKSPLTFLGIRQCRMEEEVKIIRPLLKLRKTDLLAYCGANKVPYWLDSSNKSGEYLRNNIRNEIIPKISLENPVFSEHFFQMALTFYELYNEKFQLFSKEFAQQKSQDRFDRNIIIEKMAGMSTEYRLIYLSAFLVTVFDLQYKISEKQTLVLLENLKEEKWSLDIDGDYKICVQYSYIYIDKKYTKYELQPQQLKLGENLIGKYSIICGQEEQLTSNQIAVLATDFEAGIFVQHPQMLDTIRRSAGRKRINRLYIDKKVLPIDRKKALVVKNGGTAEVLIDLITASVAHSMINSTDVIYISFTEQKNEEQKN
ncbi:MAG: tRNA lysidine(34) synthetase TilS [Culicoidibacterales bacterium]